MPAAGRFCPHTARGTWRGSCPAGLDSPPAHSPHDPGLCSCVIVVGEVRGQRGREKEREK